MISRTFSRLIAEILFPFISKNKNIHVSFSPVTPAVADYSADMNYIIKTKPGPAGIGLFAQNSETSEKEALADVMERESKNLQLILQLTARQNVISADYSSRIKNYSKKETYEFSFSIADADYEGTYKVLIETSFFKLFNPAVDSSVEYSKIENLILPVFKSADFLHIPARILFNTIGLNELSGLLNHMLKKNMLTPYHLVLLMLSMPGLSEKIRKSVSSNTFKDIQDTMKHYSKKNLTARDIAGGLYAFDEALNKILQQDQFSYSEKLDRLSYNINKIVSYELYFRKDFNEWIEEIIEKDMLYRTLAKCSDELLRNAFSGYGTGKYEFLESYLSSKRLNEIFSGYNKTELSKSVEAGSELIRVYRREYNLKRNFSHESFGYLMASVTGEEGYEKILKETGWFILSTALKQSKPALAEKVLSNINRAASMLIEDILSGTVNPDVIHDEMQINKAREICVGKMLQLQEDGAIDLEY